MRRLSTLLLILIAGALPSGAPGSPPKEVFTERGYYLTFMRMPTYGLREWKKTIDLFQADGGNLLILWAAGGFRSRKFPETWEHNREHANIRKDFLRELIDHAHTRKVRVLLGFTPFGYDGVNRMAHSRPEWKATGPDGQPTRRFGIHSWGYNLCPARADTQQFMREYVREMYFDFYPNADGLFVESSDYAACHCPQCGPQFFQHEFRFVKELSEEVWRKTPGATVVLYPHYFSGARVPGLDVTAVKQPFDARWTLFFTPHSAHPEPELIARARHSIWWDDSPALHTPARIREGARRARQIGCSGYVPSFEAFSYVAAEPEEGQQYLVGKRQVPLGFGWLDAARMPYGELPARVNRLAYREYTRNPDLSEDDFRTFLGRELFGEAASRQAVEDALALQRLLAEERTWCQPAPLASPERVRAVRAAGQLTPERRERYRRTLDQVRAIEERHRRGPRAFQELRALSRWILRQWEGESGKLLAP